MCAGLGRGAREARNVGRAGATEEVAWSMEREQKAAQRRYTGRLWPVISLSCMPFLLVAAIASAGMQNAEGGSPAGEPLWFEGGELL